MFQNQAKTDKDNQNDNRNNEVAPATPDLKGVTGPVAPTALTETQKKLQVALAKIPKSVATVKAHPGAEDAKRVFVVIREVHYSDQLPKEIKESASRCQAQVYNVLKQLNAELGSIAVFKDGMDPEMAKNYQARIEHFYKHADLAKTLETQLGTSKSSETSALHQKFKGAGADEKILNTLLFLEEYQSNRENLFAEAKNDAAINLALRRSIKMSGPEDAQLVEQTLQLAKENPLITIDDPRFEQLSDKREAHIMQTIGNSRDSVVISIFGGSHDFANDVEQWNKDNPKNKIRLIEVTTAEYSREFAD